MSLIDYLCEFIGIPFNELGTASQTAIILSCCIILVFTLLFIIRATLGAAVSWIR